MGRKTDLLNKKIGYLTVVAEAPAKNSLVRWECLCICGKTTIKNANYLKRCKNTVSCGCKMGLHIGPKRFSPLMRSVGRIYNSNYKKDTDLTLDEFYLISQQNCYYCNKPPSNSFCAENGEIFKYNGLDRLDSNRAHTKDNVVPCCKKCNTAKSNMVIDDFLSWIKDIYFNRIVIS